MADEVESSKNPGTSNLPTSMVDQLRPIFPQLSNDELREASERYSSVDDAIDGLLEKIPGGNGKYFSLIISNITSKKTGTSINEKLIFNKWKL